MPVLRPSTTADVPAIMDIIIAAKSLLHADGIPQWQNGTPNEDTITADIEQKQAYVLDLDGTIVASAALVDGTDPNYDTIYDGQWQPNSDTAYAAIHRTCVSSRYHGRHLGSLLLSSLIERGTQLGLHQFRIDTHEKNLRMQYLISQAGFMYSGNVRMNNDPADMRRVYQLFVK
ncbi:MAG: GNAT family N-acetyltransferase [Bifidobacteriaceae bacterium]|jgi:RimJ/RimL family protein N-acetyltransferase|nr:GNAT family N-acetyltransferase [Bifidobacteriaceae bacterium]